MCQSSESSSAFMLMRIPSSHGDYSDFEFDFSDVSTDEPLVSPNLHNFSANWKDAASSMVSATQFYAEHVNDVSNEQALDGVVTDSDSVKCPHTYFADGVNDMNEHTFLRNCDCLFGASSGGDVHAGGVSTIPDQNQKVTPHERSLILNRREVEQLCPLVTQARNKSSDQVSLRSSSSTSRSSSDTSSSNSPSVSFESVSSSPKEHPKKNRKWPSKLAFLQTKKLASAPKAVEYPHHHNLHQAPAMMTDKWSGHHAPEFSDRDDDKGESPTCRRRSMSSGGSSASVVKRERDMDQGRRKSKSASTPVSPAASPSRAAGPFSPAKGPVGRSSSPMRATPAGVKRTPLSPHAQHYRQQRARADEVRRRTLLPYRQPLFAGVCFSAQLAC